MTFILFSLTFILIACAPPGSNGKLLGQFSNSLSTNRDLPVIVSWARSILSNPTNLPGNGPLAIKPAELPKEVFGLYRGANAEVAEPMAAVWPVKDQGHVVSINFVPGSIYRYVILIGADDFKMPENAVKEWKRLDNGVFVGVDWP